MEQIERWRSLAPENIGIAVKANNNERWSYLVGWLSPASQVGEKRVALQIIANKEDGARIPAAEKQVEQYFNLPPGDSPFSPERRTRFFANVVEPTLQRELRQRGVADEKGSYSAELIGYLEVV